MHQEYVNPDMNQINEPCKQSITETNRIVSDTNQGKKVDGKHLEIKRSGAKSDRSVEDHPVEPVEYHKSSQVGRTDQTRTASVRYCSH